VGNSPSLLPEEEFRDAGAIAPNVAAAQKRAAVGVLADDEAVCADLSLRLKVLTQIIDSDVVFSISFILTIQRGCSDSA
jgi:hypothetical protein